MIQLTITATCKGYHPSSQWSIFDTRKKTFPSIQTAKDWLKDEYGNCRRYKMFQDVGDEMVQTGYIYGYRNSDISYLPVEKWLQQDWIEFQRVESVDLGKER